MHSLQPPWRGTSSESPWQATDWRTHAIQVNYQYSYKVFHPLHTQFFPCQNFAWCQFLLPSELTDVKEHDQEVTLQAKTAKEDVSWPFCPFLPPSTPVFSIWFLCLFSYSWRVLYKSLRRMPVCWLSTMHCMSCSGRGWRSRWPCWLLRRRHGAMLPTAWLSRSFSCILSTWYATVQVSLCIDS